MHLWKPHEAARCHPYVVCNTNMHAHVQAHSPCVAHASFRARVLFFQGGDPGVKYHSLAGSETIEIHATGVSRLWSNSQTSCLALGNSHVCRGARNVRLHVAEHCRKQCDMLCRFGFSSFEGPEPSQALARPTADQVRLLGDDPIFSEVAQETDFLPGMQFRTHWTRINEANWNPHPALALKLIPAGPEKKAGVPVSRSGCTDFKICIPGGGPQDLLQRVEGQGACLPVAGAWQPCREMGLTII